MNEPNVFGPHGLTFVDTAAEHGSIAWAHDEKTGTRYVFDFESEDPDWRVDVDSARYAAARKAAIISSRSEARR